ncbi:MAG: DUF2804 domain-containing protein [Anaeromyxobacteraceae bacterium]
MDVGFPPLPAAPAEAIGSDGAPHFGAFAGSLDRVALERASRRGVPGAIQRIAREKRWTYLFAASDEAMVAAAIVEAGWFAAGFAWVLDRSSGTLVFDRSVPGLPGLNARVDDRMGQDARATFSGAGLSMEVRRNVERYEWTMVSPGGFRAELALSGAAAPAPFVLVAPVSGPGVRVTQKAGGLAATGAIQVGRRTLRLDGGTGGVDTTQGLLARETSWRWAFGTGRSPGGAPIAFNLAEGFGGVPPGDPGENALLAGSGTVRLPPVTFAFDRKAPRSPWRVTAADGSVDLAFAPVAVHREVKNLLVLRTRFAQVAGTFTGRLLTESGPMEVSSLPGVVEDHWAVW